jgi:hypothetical protein
MHSFNAAVNRLRFPKIMMEPFPVLLPYSREEYMVMCILRKHHTTKHISDTGKLFRKRCRHFGEHYQCAHGRWCHYIIDGDDEQIALRARQSYHSIVEDGVARKKKAAAAKRRGKSNGARKLLTPDCAEWRPNASARRARTPC